MLVKFDEKNQLESYRGALALRKDIEKIVDEVWKKGIRNLCWLGIGGTWASCLQVCCHMQELSSLDFFSLNAAEYCATGNKRVGKGTCIVISSVTGTTQEIRDALKKAHADGAEVIGFIDKEDSPLASEVDYRISYKANEQLKFFMTADRFMFNAGEMPFYEEMYEQYDAHLPQGLVDVEKSADEFGRAYALKHKDDSLHYFIGAGSIYGATYSYAMCYWEEQHWIHTKSIHSAEFFHGTLEIIDHDSAVTLFIGEDSQRGLGERVARFLPKVCDNFTVIDSKDYPLPGIDEKYRGYVSHLVTHAVTNRIDAHIENLTGHDMSIRRYYRKMDY